MTMDSPCTNTLCACPGIMRICVRLDGTNSAGGGIGRGLAAPGWPEKANEVGRIVPRAIADGFLMHSGRPGNVLSLRCVVATRVAVCGGKATVGITSVALP
jgi:hypothetical protein